MQTTLNTTGVTKADIAARDAAPRDPKIVRSALNGSPVATWTGAVTK